MWGHKLNTTTHFSKGKKRRHCNKTRKGKKLNKFEIRNYSRKLRQQKLVRRHSHLSVIIKLTRVLMIVTSKSLGKIINRIEDRRLTDF